MIQISALEKYLYCPRQCALIHVDRRWEDNRHTVRGHQGHRRADQPGAREERGRIVVRSVPLFSECWGLAGRADVVEVTGDGRVVPVEYKVGSRHGRSADVQLCAQALCLEEMLGVDVPVGAVWYSGRRRRDPVEFDAPLRALTAETIGAVHALLEAPLLPTAVNDARCGECQLFDQCLPALTDGGSAVRDYLESIS